jgi:hypothetical protein
VVGGEDEEKDSLAKIAKIAKAGKVRNRLFAPWRSRGE